MTCVPWPQRKQTSPIGRRWVALAALAAGVLYVYFPYHLVDIYVRGALNDSLLLAWLPWLFLVFDRLLLGTALAGRGAWASPCSCWPARC